MAKVHYGRRPALIPGSNSLSPEEAQDVLQRRSSHETVSSLDTNSQGLFQYLSERQLLKHQGRTSPPYPDLEVASTQRHAKDTEESQPYGPMIRLSHKNEKVETAARKDHLGRVSIWERSAYRDPAKIQLDNKRKHAAYSDDEQRKYSVEVSENIPHMSEVDSEDGIRSTRGDFFGDKEGYSLSTKV